MKKRISIISMIIAMVMMLSACGGDAKETVKVNCKDDNCNVTGKIVGDTVSDCWDISSISIDEGKVVKSVTCINANNDAVWNVTYNPDGTLHYSYGAREEVINQFAKMPAPLTFIYGFNYKGKDMGLVETEMLADAYYRIRFDEGDEIDEIWPEGIFYSFEENYSADKNRLKFKNDGNQYEVWFHYDEDGNALIDSLEVNGDWITYGYSKSYGKNRLTSIKFNDVVVGELKYNSDGNLLKCVSKTSQEDSVLNYSYDANGKLTKIAFSGREYFFGSDLGVKNYTYTVSNHQNNKIVKTYDRGRIEETYNDAQKLILYEKYEDGVLRLQRIFEYDESGNNLTRQEYVNYNNNGVEVGRSVYNGDGDPISIGSTTFEYKDDKYRYVDGGYTSDWKVYPKRYRFLVDYFTEAEIKDYEED